MTPEEHAAVASQLAETAYRMYAAGDFGDPTNLQAGGHEMLRSLSALAQAHAAVAALPPKPSPVPVDKVVGDRVGTDPAGPGSSQDSYADAEAADRDGPDRD